MKIHINTKNKRGKETDFLHEKICSDVSAYHFSFFEYFFSPMYARSTKADPDPSLFSATRHETPKMLIQQDTGT